MTRASTAVTILLFVTKSVRMFSFGSTGVILALYLRELSFQDQQLGTLITLSLLGDSVISLAIILTADRFGRWKMLILGCGLKLVAGVMFALPPSRGFWELTLAATFGVLSPSGNEVGPFMALEQAILADAVNPAIRTSIFAWYNLAGYFASAAGAAESGSLVDILHKNYGWAMLQSYQAIFVQFSALALLSALIFIFGRIPNKQQDEQPLNPYSKVSVGLSAASSQIVLQLSVLFAADSFAGSLVTGTLLAYYFRVTYGVSATFLGGLLFIANVVAGISSVSSGFIATRFGLINTMVFTHLPSNILTICIPLMPSLTWATAIVFLRYSVSQMDVAPRQSYVAGVVHQEERTITIGITNVVKSFGAALGPLVTGWLAARNLWKYSFFICGILKIIYDMALLYKFRHVRPDSENVTQ